MICVFNYPIYTVPLCEWLTETCCTGFRAAAGLVKELMMEPLSGYWWLSRFPPQLTLMVSDTTMSFKKYHRFWYFHLVIYSHHVHLYTVSSCICINDELHVCVVCCDQSWWRNVVRLLAVVHRVSHGDLLSRVSTVCITYCTDTEAVCCKCYGN